MPPVVHILHKGFPLCRFTYDVPGEWEEGHEWVGMDKADDASCVVCLKVAEDLDDMVISVANVDGHWCVLWNGKIVKRAKGEDAARGYALALLDERPLRS